MNAKHNLNQNPIPLPILGLLGGLSSCIAEVFTFPFDNVKTRIQMNGKAGMPFYTSTTNCIFVTFSNNGFNGFFKGISAALLRQITYSSVKIYFYEHFKKIFRLDAKDSSFIKKFISGGCAGAIGCVIGNPFDILKIRLINDINGIKYKGIIDATRQIIAVDSYAGFFKGLNVNIARAVSLNAAELSCFDQFKDIFENMGLKRTGLLNIFFSSCAAGFFGSLVSSPADVTKSRFMNQMKNGTAIKCALDIFKNEGFSAFYKGFTPYCARILVFHLVIVFFFVVLVNPLVLTYFPHFYFF